MERLAISHGNFLIDQINCAGRRDAFPSLDLWLENSDLNLLAIAVSEPPWFLRRCDYSSNRFSWVRAPSLDNNSLCGFFVNSLFSFRQIFLTNSNRVCAIQLDSDVGQCILISFYLQPDSLLGLDELDEAISLAKRRCPNVLVLGDCNGHSPLWGPQARNPSGEKIESLVLTNDLCILNDPDSPATFSDNRGSSHWLDISLATRTLFDHVVSWTVLEGEFPSSDHELIRTRLRLHPSKPESRTVYSWNKANWEDFNLELEEQLPTLDDHTAIRASSRIDEAIDSLTTIINSLTKKLVPKSKPSGHKKAWFTEEVRQAWRVMRTAKNRIRRHPDEKPIYLETRRSFQSKVKDAKRAAFGKFCSSVRPRDTWKNFKRLNRKRMPPVPDLSVNGEFTSSSREKADVLADRFFVRSPNILTRNLRIARSRRSLLGHKDIAEDEIEWSADDEVAEAIRRTRSLSACGPDGISNIVLKRCSPVIVPFLTNLFNACIRLGYFPVSWRRGLVVPVPKGRDNLTLAKNWRPITLLSNVGKIFEKILCSRLTNFCESRNLFSCRQFGFRSRRGCEPALWAFADEIYSAFNARRQVAAVSLDLTSAFDSVNHDLLVSRLLDISCPTYLSKTIESFLDSRCVTLALDGENFPFSPQMGVPQGSCISPTLFLIFINSLADSISSGSSLSLFADDCLLYTEIGKKNEGLSILQSDVNRALAWAKEWQMCFNPSKSHLVRFSRLKKPPKIKIDLDGAKLKEEEAFKYLGILFDKKMLFTAHIREALSRSVYRLMQIRRLAAPLWGCDPQILLCLVKACALSSLLYGSVIWSPSLRKKTILNSLLRVYRLGALSITGAFKTTSTTAAVSLACLNFPEMDVSKRLLRMKSRLHALALAGSVRPRSGRYASPGSILHDLEDRLLHQELEDWEKNVLEDNQGGRLHDHLRQKATAMLLEKVEDSLWTSAQTASSLKNTQFHPSVWKSIKPFSEISRRELTHLSRFLTGHMDCGSYHHRFGHNPIPVACRLCQSAPETRDHFIRCPALSEDLLNCFDRPLHDWNTFHWTKQYLRKLKRFTSVLAKSLAHRSE